MDIYLFPFADYWSFYFFFTCFVMMVLALDLGVFHKEAHVVGFKEAAIWSVVWVIVSLLFCVVLYYYALYSFADNARLLSFPGFSPQIAAKQVALEFLTGYIVEKALAVDNIFVFVVVFSFFAIPPKFQHRVLFYGIFGALVFRAIFIALGTVLLQYKAIVVLFGVLLILTGVKMFFAKHTETDPSKNILVRWLKNHLPITSEIHGHSFFVKINSKLHVTPLFLALIFLELSDIIFAVDSVPAIFAITKEPLIVFTSNIFAILGLRSMYFLLGGVVHRFFLLKYALGVVLIFVGLKMSWLNDLYGGKFPISWSLSFISGVVALAIVLSLFFTRSDANSSKG